MIDNINLKFNKNITNISYTLQNDGIHSTSLNVSFDNFYDIGKLRFTFSINFPENDQDQRYKREYFRTTADLGKLLKGAFGNSFTEQMIRNVMVTTKNLSIPLKKGFYYIHDFSFPEIFLPYGLPTRACLKSVLEGKIRGQKKSVRGSSWEFFIHRI
ncbi:CLUMA_CG002904, isoform A [Clunio marinus]|uniref:CLUMA_CG002904, isoform A n=1 Tax=Clunio marinus TaxID=568069 RepID=A0A1J1HM58_9DIPT|nr:CLUMA_CG002904, isoform A [Clunio marinus]